MTLPLKAQAAPPLFEDAMQTASERLDALAKPPGSLGELERFAVRLAGITGKTPPDLSRRAVLVFCADNGVCAEDVGSAPQSVTRAQAINIARGMTGVAVLAKAAHAEVWVADVGMNEPTQAEGVLDRRIRAGTGNIRIEDAMTQAEAIAAIGVGIALASEAAASGYAMIGIGEMGIGNTTTSAAVLSALTGADPNGVTGIGGGIGSERLVKKRGVIREALRRANPDMREPLEILAALGGLDICAMAGACIGGAMSRLPVVIDGFIGAVAALAASRLMTGVGGYLFASHLSEEPGAALALSALGLRAPLRLRMRLGEGSGCPLLFSMLDFACAMYSGMATFEEARIDTAYLKEIVK